MAEKEMFPLDFEEFAAQELRAHGYNLYYFNNKKQGELDFVIYIQIWSNIGFYYF